MTLHLTESLSRTAWPPYRLANLEPHQVWEQAGVAEERAFAFSQGNLSILKALSSERDFKPQVLLDNHHPTFSLLRKRLTDLQWRLLKAIALQERVAQPHAFEFLVANKLGAASSVERALRNLLQTDLIIKEEEEGYRLSNTLLMRWIQSLYGSEKALT